MPATISRPASPLLRYALLGDAAASGAMGLLLAVAAAPLAGLLGLPETPLRAAGLALLPWAACLAWLGTRAAPASGAVRAVIAVNLLWTADSLLLLALLSPTALGAAFVLAQGAAVAGFALAQWLGLRGRAPVQALA